MQIFTNEKRRNLCECERERERKREAARKREAYKKRIPFELQLVVERERSQRAKKQKLHSRFLEK